MYLLQFVLIVDAVAFGLTMSIGRLVIVVMVMNKDILDAIEANPERYEVRVFYIGALVCNSNDIKMLRFNLGMKEHYRSEQEKHDLLIQVFKGLL